MRLLTIAAFVVLVQTQVVNAGRGDANHDSALSVSDVFYIVNFVHAGGPAPLRTCLGDANSDQQTTSADAIYLLNHLFATGPEPPQVAERCNDQDDDCDGIADNGFDLGVTCSQGVGGCERTGTTRCTVDGLGTECSATAGTPQTESCNGLDDDCDGNPDNGFDLGAACSAGQGICQRFGSVICDSSGVGTACSATPGTGATETCNTVDDDCDGFADNGFRNPATGLYDSDFACGSCGINCTQIFGSLPNASGQCVVSGTPQCVMNCDAGTFDLNGLTSDGCEFVLDADAIYVSGDDPAAANDTQCGRGPVGTGAGNYPCRTINHGISRATAPPARSKILVADASYNEAVTLSDGKSVLGGYRPDTWERHLSTTSTIIHGASPTGNHDRTVIAAGISLATEFEGFVVRGSINSKTSGNSYAIYVANSNANLTIRNNVIQSGRGGPGAAAAIGSDGAPGPPGTGRSSSNAAVYDAKTATGAGFCDSSDNRTQLNRALGICSPGVDGGNGGRIECPPSSMLTELSGKDGSSGQPGPGPGGGAAGVAGDAGEDSRLEGNLCPLGAPPFDEDGQDGGNGGIGANGAGVSGCASPGGSVMGGHWTSGSTPFGLPGSAGGGGGGGGAGGGAFCIGCPENKHRLGGHGGGGGAGGCGGDRGNAGSGGGGVFGIFILGGTAPDISNNVITRGEGGLGGLGGNGGTGGEGGAGGLGGLRAVPCTGRGGTGGTGGRGGHGSGGGGGCGGSSFAIYTSGLIGPTPTYCDAGEGNLISGGSPGQGGQGGLSFGNPGGSGQAGQILPCS